MAWGGIFVSGLKFRFSVGGTLIVIRYPLIVNFYYD